MKNERDMIDEDRHSYGVSCPGSSADRATDF